MSSTFYISNDVSRRKNYYYAITRLQNSCLITFLKEYRSSHRKCRSIHRRCFVKIAVLTNFANFTGKHLLEFFLKSCRPSACKYFKKRLQHKCFPVKLLRTPILKNICKPMFLVVFYKKGVLKNFAIFTERK